METEEEQVSQRPPAISLACTIGFVGAALVIPLIFSKIAREVGSWYPPYLAISATVGLICILGIWNMKKWGVYAYIGFIIVNQAVLLSMELWTLFSLLIPAIVAGIAFTHLKKMS